MNLSFSDDWGQSAHWINEQLRLREKDWVVGQVPGLKSLRESMAYSTLDGGKRFRPVLAVWTHRLFSQQDDRISAFACALEYIHCYSLIHDDLPCMDNDDLRRGRPTNHKVYGEGMALLAGSALLSEAFRLVSTAYSHQAELAVQLIQLLAEASGGHGMVGGQAIDIQPDKTDWNLPEVMFLHSLKTGALIRAAVVGGALVGGAKGQELEALKKYGDAIGLAFQISDDLLDYDPQLLEAGSYPALVGPAETRKLLDEVTQKSMDSLSSFGPRAERLRELSQFNRDRKI